MLVLPAGTLVVINAISITYIVCSLLILIQKKEKLYLKYSTNLKKAKILVVALAYKTHVKDACKS